jgi:hypothetical protein
MGKRTDFVNRAVFVLESKRAAFGAALSFDLQLPDAIAVRATPDQARVSANASALAPSAAAKPNVRSTMVMIMLLQTLVLVFSSHPAPLVARAAAAK